MPAELTFRSSLLALGMGALLAAGLPTQDLAQDLATRLAAADVTPTHQLFELGHQLLDLAPESDDAFRAAILAAAEGKPEKARLAVAVALAGLKEDATYGPDLFTLLEPLAASADPEVRAYALALCGDPGEFNSRLLPDVRAVVEKNCTDELVPPLVRIEAALALWRIGTTPQQGIAKKTLEQFLRSSDRDLRVRGALALAETNIEGGKAWSILRELANEPTEDGRRARLYLQREQLRREFSHSLAKLSERLHGTGAAGEEHNDYALLDEIRNRIHLQHVRGRDVTDQELLEYAAKGMLSGLDPHSTFFTSEEFKKFFFDLDREYGGIGAFVNFDQDGDFSIVRPIYSGPAYNAGMLSGDKIIEVDGWETAGHSSEEIIKNLKGKPGSEVALKVFRSGLPEPYELTITRQRISVPSVNWAMVPGDIGYIELMTFSSNISDELQVALDDLIQRGAKGLVLDVRNNTGGFLSKAVDVCEKFLPPQTPVLYTEGPAEGRRDYVTRSGRFHTDLPLAVLTNNFSASASEITAGALQDHQRAVIIGERTYGKGTVQHPMELMSDPHEPFDDANGDRVWQEGEDFTDRNGNGIYDAGSHIKLTVAKYYLPSGRSPHREFDKDGRIVDPDWGVIPDKQLKVLERKPEDAWKNALVFSLLKKNVFREYVRKHLPSNEQLFRELAEGDGGDCSRYPEFDAFYEGLETQLSKDDVRRWLRFEVRDQVSDLRGAVYPGYRALGDPQEDAQLQEAVRTLLEKVGKDIGEIEAYAKTLKIPLQRTAEGGR